MRQEGEDLRVVPFDRSLRTVIAFGPGAHRDSVASRRSFSARSPPRRRSDCPASSQSRGVRSVARSVRSGAAVAITDVMQLLRCGKPLGDEGAGDAVGPAEPVLQRVFAAAAGQALHNVVLFQQLAAGVIFAGHAGQPVGGDPAGEGGFAIAFEPRDRDPLQGRPAVGIVPLLPGVHPRGAQPALADQRGQRLGSGLGAIGRRDADEQREGHGGGAPARDRVRVQVVIGIIAGGVPQMAVDRHRAGVCRRGVAAGAGIVLQRPAVRRDAAFEPVEQAVEIDRDDARRTDRRQRLAIGEPARTKVPAALGAGA
ncbi:hypothetical protein WR25_04968 [Diploscapter pachys]|uniref:Uncharacterized protein n=1 Tax=Diploscapter pachys TaxID=2018661 RepID=A0A2A2KJ88_9BILA|nr:hypothetical protein WR25_04968 [Diploscapter pachys]